MQKLTLSEIGVCVTDVADFNFERVLEPFSVERLSESLIASDFFAFRVTEEADCTADRTSPLIEFSTRLSRNFTQLSRTGPRTQHVLVEMGERFPR